MADRCTQGECSKNEVKTPNSYRRNTHILFYGNCVMPALAGDLTVFLVTAMIFEIDPRIIGPDELRADPKLAEAADLTYETSQSGVRAMLPCALSYVPVSQVIPSATIAGLARRVSTPKSSLRDRVLAKQFAPGVLRGQVEYLFDVGNWSQYFKSEPGKVYGTMLMMLQLPFSQGSVHIPPKSAAGPPTMLTKPVIDPQYYGGEGGGVDFDIMTAGQKFAAKICSTAPLSNIIKSRVFPPQQGATADEEDFTDFVRNFTASDWHPVGSCGMGGSAGIAAGVVDDRLRVYGVGGLRVVDASIMPLQICAHVQATIYAIGEKGSAMILEDRRVGG
ncbi:hypothetical protein BU16DRAFT_164875 [Lophium mytilinum]|uniref:Glucose-methanol-choline oxidoreductase C-terminal domain-containing protein n=1 Tax=Lophium mytilinum TaxID=390894 RepID=A0A6A6QBF9_9PEZI|nr:hypothetical protein BU16DRAFT_164875 [Lophium mytilinum]